MTLAGEASKADSDTESTVNNLKGVITILMVHYNHKYRDSDRVAEMMHEQSLLSHAVSDPQPVDQHLSAA